MNQQERDRLERQREGDRRFYLWLFGSLAGVVILGVIAIVYVLASNGLNNSGGEVQPAATQLSSTTETQAAQPPVGHGKDLFASTCGGCHTLAAAGTTGTLGPNLDDLQPDQATVQAAIQDGPGAMPANLLTGAQARQVAAFVAASAGH
ncbi:MAG TPA: c-type cytochrome [Solirubrobacterales bacterium]|jgi:mono/diheme cytochrome c family protein|nr:c-type cytochrome [Solirubrobacterales bacterium]